MISLIHPSRGRPEKAWQTLENWADKAGKNFDHILSLDSDDITLPQYQEKFNSAFNVIIGENANVVQATNRAAKRASGRIFVYLSDDFDCPDNWVNKIEEEFFRYFKPRLLKVDDCLQPFGARVCTMPIMNKLLYEELGYFWNPEYYSMFVDQDLYEVCVKNHWLYPVPYLKFPHNHYSNGKAVHDDTYKKSEANWNQGKEVFKRRQAVNFPI